MLLLVHGLNSRLPFVNHALISPILTNPLDTQFFEWHFLHRFHRLNTLIITLSFQAWNLPNLQFFPTAAFLFFFSTDSTDSPDCLLFTDSISVFLLYSFFLFSIFFCFWFRVVDYADIISAFECISYRIVSYHKGNNSNRSHKRLS